MDRLAETLIEERAADMPAGRPRLRREYRNKADTWGPEKIALLAKLWGDGLSASDIASELPGNLTRSAVLGKVHRLGLKKRKQCAATPRTRKRRGESPLEAKLRRRAMLKSQRVPWIDAEPLPAEDPTLIPLEQRKTFAELENTHCRFPYGDPGTADFFFCGAHGANASAGTPYCAGHRRVAYTPAPDRRKEPGRPTPSFRVREMPF